MWEVSPEITLTIKRGSSVALYGRRSGHWDLVPSHPTSALSKGNYCLTENLLWWKARIVVASPSASDFADQRKCKIRFVVSAHRGWRHDFLVSTASFRPLFGPLINS